MTDGSRIIGVYESDPAMGGVLREILLAEGYRPESLSASSLPDSAAVAGMLAVLVDFPPGRDGRRETRRIIGELRRRAAPSRIPIIGLTADFDVMRRGGSRFRDLPDFALLGKPFGIDELTDLLAVMLARAGSGDDQGARPPARSAGIVFADTQGCYTDANRSALAMLGYSLDELRHLRVADVMDAPERVTRQEWERYQREGSWASDVVRLRRKNGEVLVAQIHAAVIHRDADHGPTHVAWIRPRTVDEDEAGFGRT